MGDITELLAELADVHDRLIALPEDAFANDFEALRFEEVVMGAGSVLVGGPREPLSHDEVIRFFNRAHVPRIVHNHFGLSVTNHGLRTTSQP